MSIPTHPRHLPIERQLERASRLQRRLLPAVPCEFHGYRFDQLYLPYDQLGGDLYAFECRPDCLLMLLADISGHGLEASLAHMLVRALFHESAQSTIEPVNLLRDMNERLYRNLPAGFYVCAGLVRIGPSSRGLDLVNAGLPRAHVLRGETAEVETIPSAGNPLGLLLDRDLSPYEPAKLELGSSDVLVVVTDGMEDDGLTTPLPRGGDGAALLEEIARRARINAHCGLSNDDATAIAITRLDG